MKINSFTCNNFGGVTSQEVSFSDGLNVILGPNEAGKSTLIEGIFATLFRGHRLKKSSNVDKEFAHRFRPYPNGDSMVAKMSFNSGGMEYEISKEWGVSPSVALNVNSQLVKDDESVAKKLQELLKYGERTYENIVFAKQKDIKEALDRISRDEETSTALGDLLRKAIMALDGISLEKLQKRLNDEYILLQGRWDIANNRPEANKGIDNRWKAGVGEVLSLFYEKEKILGDMNYAQQVEEEYAVVVQKLKDISAEKNKVKAEINEYKQIEGDILQRAIIEPQLQTLKKEVEELRRVSKEYPVKEEAKKNGEKKLNELNQSLEQLTEEIKLAQKVKEANNTKELLAKIERIEKEIAELTSKKSKLIVIEDADISKLEELQIKMDTAKVSMEAGTLLGKINKANKSIYITRGLDEREEITVGTKFSASGYLKVEVDSDLELEIRAGEIDFGTLKNRFNQSQEELNKLLAKLEVKDVVDAKMKHRLLKDLTDEIKRKQSEIRFLLGGKKIEDLKQQVFEAQNIKARTVEEVSLAKDNIGKLIVDLLSELKTLENTLKGWTQKYGDLDKVIDLLASDLKDIGEKENTLQNLVELPERFKTPEEFRKHLLNLGIRYDEIQESESKLKEQFYDVGSRLPEVSLEELQPMFKDAELRFRRRLARLHHLLKAKQVFERKLKEMDKGSFEPLVKAFSKYLSIVTLGNYDTGEITPSLFVDVIKKGNKKLPINLLSAGTYDCVLLALRFSLLDYLFVGMEGLLILDDCLVNLDPKRKAKAVEMIKEFAKNNQVIFTTCDPNTASLLGGTILEIQVS